MELRVSDVLPADEYDALLAEVDGERFGGAYVRGGRVERDPVPPPPAAADRADATPRWVRPASRPAARPVDLFEPSVVLAPELGAPSPWSDAETLRSFRTDPLSRLIAALRRLLRL
jgi:hypothetical protein